MLKPFLFIFTYVANQIGIDFVSYFNVGLLFGNISLLFDNEKKI